MDQIEHDVKDSNVMGEINVTPMVDVMLVLLIIFMVVTPALMQGMSAQLPLGFNLKDRPHDEERTTLGIDRNGNYFLNKQPIEKENAVALLRQEFAAHPQDQVLFIKADRMLKYSEMLAAMDIARDAGARVIAAVTESAGEDEDEGSARR